MGALPATIRGPVILAILLTGSVTVAYSFYAQSDGKRWVRPAGHSQSHFKLQPVCTAIIAWVLLNETLETAGWLGGALVRVAVLLVAVCTTSISNTTAPLQNDVLIVHYVQQTHKCVHHPFYHHLYYHHHSCWQRHQSL